MKYLLIDNCVLRDLIDSKGISHYILELEQLISSGQIGLITHTCTFQEWDKYKDKWAKDKLRKIKYHESQINTHSNGILAPEIYSQNYVDQQIKKIDDLLNSSRIKQLITPDIFKIEGYERIRQGLPPFKKKKYSFNDWEIISTVANYCQNNGIKELYFLSSNHTDFGDISNPLIQIDSSIAERFPDINIIYYSNYTTFFQKVNALEEFTIKIRQPTNSNYLYLYESTVKFNVLDGLYSLYHNQYKELNYIPPHILSEKYPFASSKESIVRYSSFGFSGVNDDLIIFFENIKIGVKGDITINDPTLFEGIKDYKSKIKDVLKCLTRNTIFNLRGKSKSKTVSTYYVDNENCECCSCSFASFEFWKALQGLKSESPNNQHKLRAAYIHYKLGNYTTSNNFYEEIISTAIKNKEYITFFVAKYNQKHLAVFLNNIFACKNIDKSLIDNLRKIDPLEIAIDLKEKTDYELLTYIAQEDFFYTALEKINKHVSEIKDHYFSQLYGGWSRNNEVWDLIEDYANIDAFINSNYIIFDKFSNYEALFDKVIEGLFASHSISKNQSSRLKHFDDYWLYKIILYGNEKRLRKYYGRFDIAKIEYKQSNKNGTSFLDLFSNLIDKRNWNTIEQDLDANNLSYYSMLNKYFEKIMIISGIVGLSYKQVNYIAEKLLEFLQYNKGESIHHYTITSISFFIEHQGKLINKDYLLMLLKHFLLNKKLHNEEIISNILESFSSKKKEEVFFDHEILDTIIEASLKLCSTCNVKHHFNMLASLYMITDKSSREKISNRILQKLSIEFDSELYISACLFQIIRLNKKTLLDIVECLNVQKRDAKTYQSFMGEDYFLDTRLDQIINVCFKENINTKEVLFPKFHSIHLYYEWILDMDNFNYKKFNPEWVLVYQVRYYFKRMSQSNALISFLKRYLTKKYHVGIERVFNKITNFT